MDTMECEFGDQNSEYYFSAATKKISQDFEQKLEEQQKKLDQKLQDQEQKFEQKLIEQQQNFEEKVDEKDKKIQELEKQQLVFMHKKNEQMSDLQEQQLDYRDAVKDQQRRIDLLIHEVFSTNLRCPYEIEMKNYLDVLMKGTIFFSEPLYTHPLGYSFSLVVKPTEQDLIVALSCQKGCFDSLLKWPSDYIVEVELVNQHRDRGHITKEFRCQFEQKKNAEMSMKSVTIPTADLHWNPNKLTRYLKDDKLVFRVAGRMIYMTRTHAQ